MKGVRTIVDEMIQYKVNMGGSKTTYKVLDNFCAHVSGLPACGAAN